MALSIDQIRFDPEDLPLILSCLWHPHASGRTVYARSGDKRYLHREIMKAPKGIDVDHVNGDGLDVRRCNLRLATRSQNNMNRRSQRAGMKGIYFDSHTSKWRSEIITVGVKTRSPRFETEAEAIQWRLAAEAVHHQGFAGTGTATLIGVGD